MEGELPFAEGDFRRLPLCRRPVRSQLDDLVGELGDVLVMGGEVKVRVAVGPPVPAGA